MVAIGLIAAIGPGLTLAGLCGALLWALRPAAPPAGCKGRVVR